MDVRGRFHLPPGQAYLDSCAHGLLPLASRDAIVPHLARWSEAPGWTEWTATVERARRAFARFIGARDDEVAVHANASGAVASVLGALSPRPRGRLLTLDLDFPSSARQAQAHQALGFVHEHLRTDGGGIDVETWARHLGDDAALAILPAVASFTGRRFDVARFAEAARARGAMLLVDAFQAVGTYPFDVRRLDVDFLVTGVYKWLLGAPGLAFLYVRRDHHGLVPRTSGWLAADDPYAFDPFGPLAPDARRFQHGGASVVACAGLPPSLGLLEEVGLANVARHNGALVERVMGHARERGFDVLTPDAPEERASIVTFRGPDPARALPALSRERVLVGARLGGLRVSPHLYNTEADVDRLFEVLDRLD